MRGSTEPGAAPAASSSGEDVERRPLARRVTELPVFTAPDATTSSQDGTQRRITQSANDGVFANMSAKPDRGEKLEDQPPVCPSSLQESLSSSFLTRRLELRTSRRGRDASILGDNRDGARLRH